MINNAYDSNISFSRCCICVGISRFHISKYMTLNRWPSFRLDTWIQFITTSIVLVSFALLLELSLVAISFYLYGTSILPKWPTPFSPPLTALLPSGWSTICINIVLASKGELMVCFLLSGYQIRNIDRYRTDGVIHWLMGYIVNTGALTMYVSENYYYLMMELILTSQLRLAALTGIIIVRTTSRTKYAHYLRSYSASSYRLTITSLRSVYPLSSVNVSCNIDLYASV